MQVTCFNLYKYLQLYAHYAKVPSSALRHSSSFGAPRHHAAPFLICRKKLYSLREHGSSSASPSASLPLFMQEVDVIEATMSSKQMEAFCWRLSPALIANWVGHPNTIDGTCAKLLALILRLRLKCRRNAHCGWSAANGFKVDCVVRNARRARSSVGKSEYDVIASCKRDAAPERSARRTRERLLRITDDSRTGKRAPGEGQLCWSRNIFPPCLLMSIKPNVWGLLQRVARTTRGAVYAADDEGEKRVELLAGAQIGNKATW